jgi:3''-phosphoadenosine 5''-phosphosulfate sulfotransferase (PAPS reductase)/FAD synthetase and related enzymes
MDYLDILENKSIYIIRETYYRFKNIAMLWSVGKDSTTLLWLIRKAFFGKIPFPVIHIDTSYKFPEMYAFRDEMAAKWGLNLVIAENREKLSLGMGPDKGLKFECCNELKTNALKLIIQERNLQAIFVGIRRDEHGIRAKERYFSARDDQFKWNYETQSAEVWDQYKSIRQEDEHYRIHPLLHFNEVDIWRYIQREGIPVVDLYFSKNGQRFRSIGCVPCCQKVESPAATIDEVIEEVLLSKQSERAGRAQDKEDMYTMQKLRLLGYL